MASSKEVNKKSEVWIRISLLVKFGLNKNNFFLNDNDEFEFKFNLLEKQSFTPY